MLIPTHISDLEAALLRYEEAHWKWMNTSLGAPDFDLVRTNKDAARQQYLAEYRKAYPDHIILY